MVTDTQRFGSCTLSLRHCQGRPRNSPRASTRVRNHSHPRFITRLRLFSMGWYSNRNHKKNASWLYAKLTKWHISLVSTYVVCGRLSVNQVLAPVGHICVQKSHFTLLSPEYHPPNPTIIPPPHPPTLKIELWPRTWHFEF